MKKTVLFLIVLLTFASLFAQYDSLWTKEYGYADFDKVFSAEQATDSNYTFAGFLDNPATGNYEGWLIKTDRNGDTLWTKTYGGTIWSMYMDHIIASDSGYVMTGNGVSTTDGHGGADFEAVRTDSSGNIIWRHWYGGGDRDEARSLCASGDSIILLVGRTNSFGAGGYDFYVVKTDYLGDTLWTRTYGLADSEECYSATVTSDNCILLGGFTKSIGAGMQDWWIIKTDMNGDTLWTKTFGGVNNDICNRVIETSDSCYLLAGGISGDAWLLKTDKNGDTIWARNYTDSLYGEARNVFETADGNYVITGTMNTLMMMLISKDGDLLYEAGSSANLGDGYETFETYDGCFVIGGVRNNNGYIMKLGDVTLTDFSIINRGPEYVSADSVEFKWRSSSSPYVSTHYNISLNGDLDSIDFSDTTGTVFVPMDGVCVWSVMADNDYITLNALNNDTFFIDRTDPVLLSIEELNDTAFAGPFEIEFLAADSSAGMDSAALYYMLPEDTVWSRAIAVHIGGVKYRATIPQATSEGLAYYYPELYDRAVPANVASYSSYTEVISFRITGLSGISGSPVSKYSLNIRQFGNAGISLTLPDAAPVSIRLYDTAGREVMNKSIVMVKGRNDIKFEVVQGVYFVNIDTPYGSAKTKVVKIK